MNNYRFRLFAILIAASLCTMLPTNIALAQTNGAPATPNGPTLPIPPNLVIQNVPPIPADLPATVRKYTEAVPVSGSGWHPVRREMLVAKRAGNTTQLHLLDKPLGKPRQLTNYPEPVGGGSFQPTTGDYFLFSKATGGNEVGQIYRHDLKTGTVTQLTTDDKKRNAINAWSNAGDKMAYTSLATGAQSASEAFQTELYVMNPAEPASAKLISKFDGPGWGVADWSPDDKQMLVGQFVSANESALWLLDLSSGEKTLVTPKSEGDETVIYYTSGFSRDGKGVYLITDKGEEFRRLAYLDLATRRQTILTAGTAWDVNSGAMSDDRTRLAYTTNEDGVSKLHVLDTTTNREIKLPRLPEGQVSPSGWHRATNELALSITSYRNLTETYSLDLKTGKLTRWAQTERNGYDTSGGREAELVRWSSFDKRTISGFLYRPPTRFAGKRPVLIDIHGGPEGQSTPGPIARNAYFVNEMGIALIYPNVRGSAGYGKSFLKLDNGKLREDSVKDIGALLDWIAKQPDLDKDRIMVRGGSYGGYMTLAVSTLYADRIRCAQDIVGISNFVTFLNNTETYRRDLRRVEYGDEREPDMRAFLEKISPLTNAARIQKPLFVVQGKNDPRVPFTEAEQIVAAVRKNNVPTWYLMASDEGHGFAKKNNQDYLFYATVLFMREYLLR